MGLKQITLAVNNYCNSRCVMCNIHENEWKNKMYAEDYRKLLRHEEFKELFEVSITGGEPFLRDDLHSITDVIVSELPNLHLLFINTNGMFPSKVKSFIEGYESKIPKITVSVSIEGEKDVHEIVRGVKNFELTLQTLEVATKSDYRNVSVIISTTITPFNSDPKNLHFVRELAQKMGCGYTFRMVGESQIYYLNTGSKVLQVSADEKKNVVDFISKYCKDDPFQQVQKLYLETGEISLTCTAGTDFAFLQAYGKIYPCIFSTRVIGDRNNGLTQKKITDLGKYEPCPCCTECEIYPMMNYGPNKKLD